MGSKSKVKAIRGDDGRWGVGDDISVLYEPEFSQEVAERIANMENSSDPPVDWQETRERLEAEGLDWECGDLGDRT